VVAPQIGDAAKVAASAKTAVVVVADPQESEATDRVGLTLPSAQDELVQAVAAANPRTVVVVEAGAAVTMPWLSNVSAVLDQWYAGQTDGGSLADVLFGAVNPSGHLPITFPASAAAVPTSTTRQFPGVNGKVHYSEGLNMGYRWWIDTDHTPLFPFGFGLSYTAFHYSAPRVSVVSRRTVRVHFSVANLGSRAGADVAQVYLGSPAAGEPSRQLAGFRRVAIASGHTARVTITLGAQQLAAFVGGHWQIPAGTYAVYAGDSSASAQLTQPVTFTISHSTQLPEDLR
jgi:beta-glucosidase